MVKTTPQIELPWVSVAAPMAQFAAPVDRWAGNGTRSYRCFSSHDRRASGMSYAGLAPGNIAKSTAPHESIVTASFGDLPASPGTSPADFVLSARPKPDNLVERKRAIKHGDFI